MLDNLFEDTCNARDELYASIGNVAPDVIAHAINPAFMGGPAWPALRQAFSTIHRNGSTLVISNGLADPFDDAEDANTGFGLEIYAETKEPIANTIQGSDIFKLVYATAQQAASSGQMAEFLKQYGVITMELYADECDLYEYQNEHGMVGIMIGIEHPDIPKITDFPGGEVILASVQILTPAELEYVVNYRAEGRNELHRRFKDTQQYHFLSSNRESLVSTEEQSDSSSANSEELTGPKNPWWKFW